MSGVIKLRFSFQPSILTSNMTFSPPRRLSTFFSVTEVFRRQRFPKLWTPQMESTHLLLLQIAGVTHTFLRTRLLKHLDFASAVRLDNWCNALSFLNNAFCTKPSFLALNPLLSCFQCLAARDRKHHFLLLVAFDVVYSTIFKHIYIYMIIYIYIACSVYVYSTTCIYIITLVAYNIMYHTAPYFLLLKKTVFPSFTCFVYAPDRVRTLKFPEEPLNPRVFALKCGTAVNLRFFISSKLTSSNMAESWLFWRPFRQICP